jgi:hypothetical protein
MEKVKQVIQMKNKGIKAYDEYLGKDITKEVLDTVEKGNLIKLNNWKVPFKVMLVSNNYFVMIRKQFGKSRYSVCDKVNLIAGTDNRIFGYMSKTEYTDKDTPRYENEAFLTEYLESFETGETQISPRNRIKLTEVYCKKG